MILKTVGLFLLIELVHGSKFPCNTENAIAFFKRPTYDFSVELLDRVAQETSHHFVFSPLSTWLQLMSLAEGARGMTENEIWNVTRYHRNKCFRRQYRQILNSMDDELSFMSKTTNVIVVDKLLDVKESFVDEVMMSNTTKLLSLYYNEPELVTTEVNEASDADANEVVQDTHLTGLLTSDTAYFKSDWLKPFHSVHTSTETFYSEQKVSAGTVMMMKQIDYFNITNVRHINARVLELPFNQNGRVAMLVFLPTSGTVNDLFHNLNNITLATIFNNFKRDGAKLVTVQLPRFKVTSELRNVAELINDMGVKNMFYPELAEFKGITNFPMHASLMTQIADIEVTEKGVQASVGSEYMIRNPDTVNFSANRPFAYLIVDKSIGAILFGGLYRNPSLY